MLSKVCTRADIEGILDKLDTRMSITDLDFFVSQYIISGSGQQIHYLKLIEDLKSIETQDEEKDDIQTLIIKKIRTMDSKDLRTFLTQYAPYNKQFRM